MTMNSDVAVVRTAAEITRASTWSTTYMSRENKLSTLKKSDLSI